MIGRIALAVTCAAGGPQRAETERAPVSKPGLSRRQREALEEAEWFQRRGNGFLIGSITSGTAAFGLFLGAVVVAVTGTGGGSCANPPTCTTGQPCGCTCISWSDTCHIGSPGGGDGISSLGLGLSLGAAGALVLTAVFGTIAGVSYRNARSARARSYVLRPAPNGIRIDF